MSEAADLAACRAHLRGGSRSFAAAARLLPPRMRDAATALYAFCREADDLIDRDGGAVETLAARLDAIYAGRPGPSQADRAFARVVATHAIPRTLPDALLEGFAWDRAGCTYETLADLRDYAARVAGTVGVMMARIMGARTQDTLAAAATLGVAMQLSNVARDVGEDARAGRLYLPRAALREAGVDAEAFLRAPRFTPALGRVVAALLAEADALYAVAAPAIGTLPPACRPAIHAASLLYREIGRDVARRGHDSVNARAVVTLPRKLALVPALAAAHLPSRHRPAAMLPGEIRFLVAGLPEPPSPRPVRAPWRRLDEEWGWVLTLFATLDERQTAPIGLRRAGGL